MKAYRALFVLLLFSFGYGKSQSVVKETLKYVEIFSTGFDGSRISYHIQPEGRYKEIKGSPYLYDDWHDGAIQLKTDTIASSFRMRYNMYGNEMQFIYKADTFAVSNPLKVSKVWIGNREFEYLPFVLNENQQYGYFEVIVNGPYRLLKLHGARLDAGRDPVTPYHCQNSSDRFVKTENWYYQTGKMTEPMMLPESVKSLSRIPPGDKESVAEFIRTSRLRIHRETDLIEIFRWMNKNK
jgi:hypothetical protein